MINILLNIFCMNNDLTQYLDKFKLKEANNAPFVTIYSQNILGILQMQTWKNHQKNHITYKYVAIYYSPKMCLKVLFKNMSFLVR